MKRIRKASKWIFLGASALVLASLIVGTKIESDYDPIIAGALNSYASEDTVSSSSTKEQKASLGSELCTQIIEEGAVLLKNASLDNGTKSLPLNAREKRVNIFGYGATNEGWLQYGIGSGSTKPQERKSYTLLDSFDASRYSYNKDIISAYSSLNWVKRAEGKREDTKKSYVYNLREASRSWYESQPELLENARSYSDTAIFVISRISGENTRTDSVAKESVPAEQYLLTNGSETKEVITDKTYLETTYVEEGVIDMLAENFKNVIVLINSTNAMFLPSIADADERVKSILYCGVTGESGTKAIPDLLWGNVSPSGHLADTFPMHPIADPAFANRNDYVSAVFQEGIYFGYKWYETADASKFWESSFSKTNLGISKYEEAVFRPFGYGLSYTSFSWEIKSIKTGESEYTGGPISENEEFEVIVKVTNTGDKAGKEVVQLYYTPPYVSGGIEKASVNLLDFEKTISLEPNQSMDLTLSFSAYDMASFDSYDANHNGFAGYELEGGLYALTLRSDAHTIKDELSFDIEVASTGIQFNNDPITHHKVEPLFSGPNAYAGLSIDGQGFLGNNGSGITYLSRNNFASTYPLSKADGTIKANLDKANSAFDFDATSTYNFASMPANGVEKNLRLVIRSDGSNATMADLKGETSASLKLNEPLIKKLSDFSASEWEDLLSEMSLNDYIELICFAGFKTSGIASIGKPQTRDIDGPAGFNGVYSIVPAVDPKWTAFPSQSILACSFSKRLAYNLGCLLGMEAQSEITPCNGIYGPGANLHRSPFGSRNYEYYSEDRYLSGILASNEIRGAKTNGLYMFMKHFIADEQGYNPRGTYTWMSEQVLREEYCRPFEIAVKQGEANAIMTSFNCLGNIYVGHNKALCTTLLREEWGFQGMVLTDYYVASDSSKDGTMRAPKCIAAGNDAILNPSATSYGYKPNTSNVASMNLARAAAKNIIFTYVDTHYYALTHEVEDVIYNIDIEIKAAQLTSSILPSFLLGLTIALGVILAVINAWNFLRPKVKEDGVMYLTPQEEAVHKQIRIYLPLGLVVTSLVLSLVARAAVEKSFFANFASGLFSDIGTAFTKFGFGILMNVFVYFGLIAIIATAVLFILKFIKDKKLVTVIAFSSLLLSIVATISFVGVLLFALSSGAFLKNIADVIFMAGVGISALLAFGLSLRNVISLYIGKNIKEEASNEE